MFSTPSWFSILAIFWFDCRAHPISPEWPVRPAHFLQKVGNKITVLSMHSEWTPGHARSWRQLKRHRNINTFATAQHRNWGLNNAVRCLNFQLQYRFTIIEQNVTAYPYIVGYVGIGYANNIFIGKSFRVSLMMTFSPTFRWISPSSTFGGSVSVLWYPQKRNLSDLTYIRNQTIQPPKSQCAVFCDNIHSSLVQLFYKIHIHWGQIQWPQF